MSNRRSNSSGKSEGGAAGGIIVEGKVGGDDKFDQPSVDVLTNMAGVTKTNRKTMFARFVKLRIMRGR
ncbi:hypothetical protein Pmani_039215 [Petrolisthes manimaculis]|uniref:Uncharacterized protein n=1 Tax=Petrolisthes manimaculis TaxID=1843537 RepID=A0AAE1NCX3_9EUCA|nr:hypothetical protein Pmani_039215 [Petrolisthes manimaculis]